MNVVLIHGYIMARSLDTYMSEPLGLVCLASHVDAVFKGEVKVSILDLYAMGARRPRPMGEFYCLGIDDPDVIQAELSARAPDLIGIHCNFTAHADDSLALAAIVKARFPDTPIVIGGAHPTIEGFSILSGCPSIDYVAKGEGEAILENLIRALKGEIRIGQVAGLMHREQGRIVINEPQPLIPDLDTLPIPSRKYIDMDAYTYFNRETIWYVRNSPVATIMTSRGCPYDCVFCSTKVVWKRKWRFRSLENVFREIRMLVEEHGVREFIINDDQFMTRRKRIHAFCDYFIEAKLGISFSVDSGVSIWLVDEELLAKMKRAGFYSLRFPIETGCKETLEYVNKPVNLDKARQMIRAANRLGFWTSSNIIVGFPNETREQVYESIRYVFESTLDFTSFIIAKPHAGSQMYDDFEREGLLKLALVQGSNFYRSDYDTKHLSAQELNDIVNDAHARWFAHKARFFLNPANFYLYFLPKVQSFADLAYLLRVSVKIFSRKVKPLLAAKLRNTAFKPPRLPASRQI
jgi:radical SAM superfamily enzyme YgiQ (UPF0313 family)